MAGTRVVVGVVEEDAVGDGEAEQVREAEGGVATARRVRPKTVAIENLVARGGGELGDGGGQSVLAREEHDPAGGFVRAPVTRTYQRTAYALQVQTLRDDQSGEQVLCVTEAHPFNLSGAGWTPAKALAAGDYVLGAEGVLELVANGRDPHPGGVEVYNLEVDVAHTYFELAPDAAGTGDAEPTWVHNANYDTQGRVLVALQADASMNSTAAQRKIADLRKLSDKGMLIKAAEPVSRDRRITAAFRQDTIDRTWRQYGQRNREFANSLIDRVSNRMSPDHIWELQLGGPDARNNLRWMDRVTNDAFGRMIRRQLTGPNS